MQPVSAPKKADPAPSRWAYRFERLMLTPLFRLTLRVALPFAVTFGGATLWFADQDRRDDFNLMVYDLRSSVVQREEFMVKLMAVDGATDGVAEDIREVLPLDFPVSSFDLDLDRMRETIVGLDAVQSAQVRIRSGGVLQIDVVERVPVVVWRGRSELELIDREGVLVRPIGSRLDYPHLPVMAGAGADLHVEEAMTLISSLGPLMDRFRGLERIGERRWDVVLDRSQRIMLPETGAVRALERVIAMDRAVEMLDRDVVAVDMRLPQRPTLRITDGAVKELWRIRAIEVGDNK
ncbi:cell division protein FtsQ/DivIB [Pseudoprimorskyibacter insulae]|uniref:Cell division protein FtsQ n=1 Tax=Pseudoprimorskyibacter insulae TaxID=1695997 RepID=A0A2R8AX89_9RHOB|nr:cell division protein FtsQ/DivIB [Pseudoprimorskyibacter insulae]SPF80620.1 Cell division protein FtsQ [Pseudoprimorskyibacter insulae]